MTVLRRRRKKQDDVIADIVQGQANYAAVRLGNLTLTQRRTAYRFARFHEENPHVFSELHRLAENAYQAGMQRIGMKMLFEVLRYEVGISTNGKPFKLSNSFTAMYARLMVDRYQHLRPLFVIKGAWWVPLLWDEFPEDMR